MNIAEMTPEEKSVELLKLCGYHYKNGWLRDSDGSFVMAFCNDIMTSWGSVLAHGNEQWPNLYDPANMALFWRVLNWAGDELGGHDYRMRFTNWFYSRGNDAPIWMAVSAELFIRLCLDKILELAIEAGKVKPLHEK